MRAERVRWVWCPICDAWIGATPPLLPPFWSLDKAAAMHVAGTGHKVVRYAWDDLPKEAMA